MGNSTLDYCVSKYASAQLNRRTTVSKKMKFSLQKTIFFSLLFLAGSFNNELKAQFNIPAGTYYFDNSQTQWSQVFLFIGNGGYIQSYAMSSTGNAPDVFSFNLGGGFNNATGFYFANNSGGVTAGSSSVNIGTAIGSLPSSQPTVKSTTWGSAPTSGDIFVHIAT